MITFLRAHQSAVFVLAMMLTLPLAPELALAQAASPFETGATNLLTTMIAIATPIAALLIMGLGIAAGAGRLSWAWPIGVLIGVCLIFGATPVVTWIRGLFGV